MPLSTLYLSIWLVCLQSAKWLYFALFFIMLKNNDLSKKNRFGIELVKKVASLTKGEENGLS